MNDKLAFQDLVDTLSAISWLSVYTEPGKSGSRAYSLEITGPTAAYEPGFGSLKTINGYNLNLNAKGKSNPGDLVTRINAIHKAIISDRRRGGNAQTTTVGEWTIEAAEGREGVAATSTIEIHLTETC